MIERYYSIKIIKESMVKKCPPQDEHTKINIFYLNYSIRPLSWWWSQQLAHQDTNWSDVFILQQLTMLFTSVQFVSVLSKWLGSPSWKRTDTIVQLKNINLRMFIPWWTLFLPSILLLFWWNNIFRSWVISSALFLTKWSTV